MIQESEPRKLRRGEGKNRPIGGNIADAPFAKALRDLAVDRGFKSQYSLAMALGKRNNEMMRRYYQDMAVPSPEEFGNLLITLQPNDEKMEALINAYADELSKGRAKPVLPPFENSRGHIKPLENPMSQWIENFCSKRKISMHEWLRTIGLYPSRGSGRGKFGLETLSQILQNTPEAFGLSEEETEGLSEAVVQEIQQRLQKGRRLQSGSTGGSIKKMQEYITCRTYNGSEAATELEISRERVRQLRQELRWESPLLTEDRLDVLKEKLGKTKISREKRQQTILKNRSN